MAVSTVQSVEQRKKMRRQAYALIPLIVLGFLAGMYLVYAGALPDQYRGITLGESPELVKVPDGFELTVFATELAAPRYMAIHPETGVLLVSERGANRVIALPDADQDGVYDEIVPVVEKVVTPTGLAFDGEWLYIAEGNQISRVRIDADLKAHEREVIVRDLPGGRHKNEEDAISHDLLILDNELYVTVGTSCAGCEETDSRRGTVLVYALDGSNERIFARGMYYPLGLTTNPITGALWVTDQGRPAFTGGDVPELIYAVELGDRFGYPYCNAGDMPDTKLADETACTDVKQPLVRLEPQANIADLIFYNNPGAPESYQYDAIMTLHGGVNQAEEQVGMSVIRLDIDPQTGELLSSKPTDFAAGWRLTDEPGDQIGRPFGLLLAPDGTLYISDDGTGAIYRMVYKGS